MSRASPAPAVPLRPLVVDYLFLLVGASLSLYLVQLGPWRAEANSGLSPALHDLVAFLPAVIRLPEGILLMWPVFFGTQRLRRRAEGLTAIEWLWVISWVGVALLAGLTVWQAAGNLPDFLQSHAGLPRKLWYLIFVPSMAVLALCIGLGGLVRRVPRPWTHALAFVLILWPIAPLAGVLALGKFLPGSGP
jgi:hypothetical protein